MWTSSPFARNWKLPGRPNLDLTALQTHQDDRYILPMSTEVFPKPQFWKIYKRIEELPDSNWSNGRRHQQKKEISQIVPNQTFAEVLAT